MNTAVDPRDPPWLAHARGFLGLVELPGQALAPPIARWLGHVKAWWREDETPWCGTFVGGCLAETGFAPPANAFRAKAYLPVPGASEPAWGLTLVEPCLGSILVFERKGGGHVTFAVGRAPGGVLLGLGGNQREPGARHTGGVTISRFGQERFIAAVWPRAAVGRVQQFPLPLATGAAPVSTVEA